MEGSREKFLDLKSLELAIQQDVLPAVVRVRTENGRVGTGFFQYPHIFISNAYVFPCRELLDITEVIETFEGWVAVRRSRFFSSTQ